MSGHQMAGARWLALMESRGGGGRGLESGGFLGKEPALSLTAPLAVVTEEGLRSSSAYLLHTCPCLPCATALPSVTSFAWIRS